MIFLRTLVVLVASVHAQQKPFRSLNKFEYRNNITYRTNVCERQELLYQEKIQLADALAGLNLTVAMTNYKVPNENAFFTLQNGRIKEKDPGLFVVIMDEIARRAGFEWRNSFAAIDPVDSATDGNKTWTDLLQWEVDHFDIAADYWGRSEERMALGISFPRGWYDGSIILATSVNTQHASGPKSSYWSFFLPFDTLVWVAIVGAVLFTGIVYFILERLNVDSDERELEDKPAVSIFMASLTFTGQFLYQPNAHAARLLSFSWTFWALIMTSAYTANLASFMVTRNGVEYTVSTLDDALKYGTPVCLQRYSVMDDIISKRYPDMKIVRKATEAEIFDALRLGWFGASSGCGVALTNLGTFQVYQHSKEANWDCSLTTEKRVIQSLPAGFATAVDTGVMCTSLVSYVLNLHITEMISDGFVGKAWQDHLDRIGTIDCTEPSYMNDSNSENQKYSLTPKDMSGIFMLHALLTAIAIICAFADLRARARRKPQESSLPASP